MRHVLGPRRNEFAPGRCGLTQFRAKMRLEPTIACRSLKEISTAQWLPSNPAKNPFFDPWASRFENIENKRIPVWRIGVQA